MTVDDHDPGLFGYKVVDGVVRYESPSGITTADPSQDGGCYRKWWLRYVERTREPESRAQSVGKQGHKEIERYLLTGDDVLGEHARKIRRWLPEPGPDLAVEVQTRPGDLVVGGLPINMRVDCAHARGSYLDRSGELVADPEGAVEVIDWKFIASAQYARAPDTPQMTLGGLWALERYPDASWVRLSLVHAFKRTNDGCKKTRLLRPEDVRPRVERQILPVIGNIRDVATVDDLKHVPANTRACSEYGGCLHAKSGRCDAGRQQRLVDFLGVTGARRLLGDDMDQDLLAQLSPKVADKVAELEAAEAAAAAPDPGADAVRYIESLGLGFPQTAGTAAAAVARARGHAPTTQALAGTLRPGWHAAAMGDDAFSLHKLPQQDTEEAMIALADRLRDAAAKGDLPGQDRPQTRETIPGKPETKPQQSTTSAGDSSPSAEPAPTPVAGGGPVLPPGTEELLANPVPSADPSPAEQVRAEVEGGTQEVVETPRPVKVDESTLSPAVREALEILRKGRISKEDRYAAADTLESAARVAMTEDSVGRTKADYQVMADVNATLRDEVAGLREAYANLRTEMTRGPSPIDDDGIVLLVDCYIVGQFAQSLSPYVDAKAAELAKAAGLDDIRCASDGPLGFGRWKGALAALVRENPPPPGLYVLDTRGSEIAEVVADALRPTCAMFARGTGR